MSRTDYHLPRQRRRAKDVESLEEESRIPSTKRVRRRTDHTTYHPSMTNKKTLNSCRHLLHSPTGISPNQQYGGTLLLWLKTKIRYFGRLRLGCVIPLLNAMVEKLQLEDSWTNRSLHLTSNRQPVAYRLPKRIKFPFKFRLQGTL